LIAFLVSTEFIIRIIADGYSGLREGTPGLFSTEETRDVVKLDWTCLSRVVIRGLVLLFKR
jgi:hypothetical protein